MHIIVLFKICHIVVDRIIYTLSVLPGQATEKRIKRAFKALFKLGAKGNIVRIVLPIFVEGTHLQQLFGPVYLQ